MAKPARPEMIAMSFDQKLIVKSSFRQAMKRGFAMPSFIRRRHEGGAIIVTVALALLFLLGFMGIALDFGRLFVVKTELQTAMDSCALAAAQELDGKSSNAITRARSAGITAGNLNRVNMQSVNWSAQGQLVDAEITFKDAGYVATTVSANAKYAQCQHTQPAIQMLLLHAIGVFSGNVAAYPNTRSVVALAVATRAPSQTNCAIPVGLCKKTPNYQPGEWLAGAVNSAGSVTGQFRWLDFTGNGGGARELKDLLKGEGQCNLPGANTIAGKPGNNGSAAFAYNTRFGIYQGNGGPPADGIPDQTGYAWYSDVALTQPPYPNKFSAFITKRFANAPYQGDNKIPDSTNLKTVGKIYSGSLGAVGADRRIVVAPIVDCSVFDGLGGSGTLKIDSLACILLLHPIKNGAGSASEKMWVEYIGQAGNAGSPCTTTGLAGGTGGPLVPVLVR